MHRNLLLSLMSHHLRYMYIHQTQSHVSMPLQYQQSGPLFGTTFVERAVSVVRCVFDPHAAYFPALPFPFVLVHPITNVTHHVFNITATTIAATTKVCILTMFFLPLDALSAFNNTLLF